MALVIICLGRLVILLLVILLLLGRECTKWIVPSQSFGRLRLCGENAFTGWNKSATLQTPSLRQRAHVWVSLALEAEAVVAGPSPSVAAALGVAVADLGSAGDTARHSGTPAAGEGDRDAGRSTGHCIGMSPDIADLDSSFADHSPGRIRHNPADSHHTGYRNHRTAAAGAVGPGAVAVEEAFAAEGVLAIWGLVADHSRRTAAGAQAADSDVAGEDSREWPWLRYGDRAVMCRGQCLHGGRSAANAEMNCDANRILSTAER